jgi:hypothetical protein
MSSREGLKSNGRDALAARFTRAGSAEGGRAFVALVQLFNLCFDASDLQLYGLACQSFNSRERPMVVTLKKLSAAVEANPDFAKRPVEGGCELDSNSEELAEMKRLFEFIGQYVVLFQEIEAKLDEIVMLAVGLDRRHITDPMISFLSYAEKVEFVHSIVESSAIANGQPFETEWLESFGEVMQRLRRAATQRNKLVHSLYILIL